jgi:hypothetical protein
MKKTPLSAYTDAEIFHEAAKRNRAKQLTPPNPKKLSPCPKCGEPKGVAEMRAHKPHCTGKRSTSPAHTPPRPAMNRPTKRLS